MKGNLCRRNNLIDGKHGMENLISQIYVDFHGWENHTRTRKISLNLILASKSNK